MAASKFVYVVYIRTTPERLWDALRKPEFTRAYWNETWQESEWKKGARWTVMLPDGRLANSGEILEFDPPRRMVFTWLTEFWPEMKAEGHSRVTYELERIGDTVKLTLTHEADREDSKVIGAVSQGWPALLSSLKSLLESGDALEMTKKWPKGVEELAQFGKAPDVRFERLLPGPVERVWQHLTDTKLLAGWFGDGSIEPREGGAVNLMGGHVRGVVTQWQPPKRLAYTWNVFTPGETVSAYPESYLTFELKPCGNDVMLTLIHLPVLERFEKQNAMGWHTFLDMLKASLRGEPVEDRAAYMKRNAELYGVDLKNLTR